MRLNKFLARTGIGSRRICDQFIKDGKIKINGKIITDFSYLVKDDDYIQFKNKTINYVEEDIYYILNKPINYICSSKDELNRRLILELLPTNIRLFTVGRLDYKTTGLILLTNNGDIANKLLKPKNKISKKYYVESDGKLSLKQIESIYKGIRVNGKMYRAKVEFKTKDIKINTYVWSITLFEGKNREIHNIFNHFNLKISRLHRYEFANIKIGNLKNGKFRKLRKKEVMKLNEQCIDN